MTRRAWDRCCLRTQSSEDWDKKHEKMRGVMLRIFVAALKT